MKRARIIPMIACLMLIFALQNCVFVSTYGPDGRNGESFFAVDYHFSPPYSYWDNNPSVPYNPAFGHFHHSYPGLFEFEYFINPEDYWYGTYEIWRNLGGPGNINGEPGWDGLDSYLVLYCDPNGFHEDYFEYKLGVDVIKEDDKIIIERRSGNEQFRIVLSKANVKERPAQNPKFLLSEAVFID